MRGNQYLSYQKYLTEVLTSQNKKRRKRKKRKVALPPYLMTAQPSMIDGVRNKSVRKSINMVGMEDIERSLPFTVDWKVALSKRNLSLF